MEIYSLIDAINLIHLHFFIMLFLSISYYYALTSPYNWTICISQDQPTSVE